MRMVKAALSAAGIAAAALAVPFGSVNAQDVGVVQSDILVIDPERLFEQTQLGQSILAAIEVERNSLIAFNRKVEAELEAEEKMLTDLRDETPPEEFRDMADAFDAKVQDIRRDSERRVRDLERNRERAPFDFMRRVEPVLVEIMRAAGGVIVVDARNVLLRADVVDVTNVAIARIDLVLGDGTEQSPQDDPDDSQQGGTE